MGDSSGMVSLARAALADTGEGWLEVQEYVHVGASNYVVFQSTQLREEDLKGL
jgi:hypothetical protein